MGPGPLEKQLQMKVAFHGAVLLVACLSLAAGVGGGPDETQNQPARQTQSILEDRVGPEAAAGPIFCQRDRICGSDVLPLFYRGRGLRPAWIADNLDISYAVFCLIDNMRGAEGGLIPPRR